MLIGIDGINGCGKTTLINSLRKEFSDAVFCREPGETPLGQEIREILLRRSYPIDAFSEYLLFAADHNENWVKVVRPALDQGRMVFTDRSYISSLAFQGSLGISRDVINTINDLIGLPKYDLFIILDCDLQVAKLRMNREKDIIESRPDNYMLKVREYFKGFCFAPGSLPRRYVDTTNLSPEQVLKTALDAIKGHAKYIQRSEMVQKAS